MPEIFVNGFLKLFQITRNSLLKQFTEENSMVGVKGQWLPQWTANIWGPPQAPWPSLRCLTFEPCCLQCEIRLARLMRLLCGFNRVITGKSLRTLAQVHTWIPCTLGDIELAYLHSSVGNHPKPPGEREAPNEPSLDELGSCATPALAPAQASATSCLCTTGPPVIDILWTLLTCHVLFLRGIIPQCASARGSPFTLCCLGFSRALISMQNYSI